MWEEDWSMIRGKDQAETLYSWNSYRIYKKRACICCSVLLPGVPEVRRRLVSGKYKKKCLGSVLPTARYSLVWAP